MANEIYYGCRIDPKTKVDLHKIAVEQGLCEHQIEIDPYSMGYEMKYIELQ